MVNSSNELIQLILIIVIVCAVLYMFMQNSCGDICSCGNTYSCGNTCSLERFRVGAWPWPWSSPPPPSPPPPKRYQKPREFKNLPSRSVDAEKDDMKYMLDIALRAIGEDNSFRAWGLNGDDIAQIDKIINAISAEGTNYEKLLNKTVDTYFSSRNRNSLCNWPVGAKNCLLLIKLFEGMQSGPLATTADEMSEFIRVGAPLPPFFGQRTWKAAGLFFYNWLKEKKKDLDWTAEIATAPVPERSYLSEDGQAIVTAGEHEVAALKKKEKPIEEPAKPSTPEQKARQRRLRILLRLDQERADYLKSIGVDPPAQYEHWTKVDTALKSSFLGPVRHRRHVMNRGTRDLERRRDNKGCLLSREGNTCRRKWILDNPVTWDNLDTNIKEDMNFNLPEERRHPPRRRAAHSPQKNMHYMINAVIKDGPGTYKLYKQMGLEDMSNSGLHRKFRGYKLSLQEKQMILKLMIGFPRHTLATPGGPDRINSINTNDIINKSVRIYYKKEKLQEGAYNDSDVREAMAALWQQEQVDDLTDKLAQTKRINEAMAFAIKKKLKDDTLKIQSEECGGDGTTLEACLALEKLYKNMKIPTRQNRLLGTPYKLEKYLKCRAIYKPVGDMKWLSISNYEKMGGCSGLAEDKAAYGSPSAPPPRVDADTRAKLLAKYTFPKLNPSMAQQTQNAQSQRKL